MPTILLFGYHDRESPRQWTVERELRKQGYTIHDIHTEATGLFAKYRTLRTQFHYIASDAEAVFVTFPGQYLMPLAWWLTRRPRRKLIFDAFISLHDSLIVDRRKFSPFGVMSLWLYLVDWISCHLADEIWIDTEAHRQFFIERFRLNPEKIKVVYLEARTDIFQPKTKHQKPLPAEVSARTKAGEANRFEVFFCGSYIPLQGIDHILHAAKLIQDRNLNVHFTLVGAGQTRRQMEQLAKDLSLKNVTFLPFTPLKELPALMNDADLCLGIFGTSDKAARVIPHKVYDAVAMGIPVLTRDGPGIREKFAHDPNVILCPAGDPEAIAEVIAARVGH